MAKTYTNNRLREFLMILSAILLFVIPSSAVVAPSSMGAPVHAEKKAVSPLSNISVQDFLALTPKKYKELTGEKMTIDQKLALKMTQKKIQKAIKNNQAVTEADMSSPFDTSDFNIGGFVLGLLLSVVGVLIAYLIGDEDVIKWAWIGFGIVAVIFLLTLIF